MAKRKASAPSYPVTVSVEGGAEAPATMIIGFRGSADGRQLILQVKDKKASTKTIDIVLSGGKKGSHDFIGNVVRWLGKQ